MKTKVNDITDGFGNSWPRCDLGKQCGMHVVRPGHAACWCENAKEEALLLMKENERMRNELARVNGQTMWICTCGGTDCEGRKENASLWAIAERVAKANDLLVVENAALREALERWQRLADLGLEDVVPDFMEATIISISKQTAAALAGGKEAKP